MGISSAVPRGGSQCSDGVKAQERGDAGGRGGRASELGGAALLLLDWFRGREAGGTGREQAPAWFVASRGIHCTAWAWSSSRSTELDTAHWSVQKLCVYIYSKIFGVVAHL